MVEVSVDAARFKDFQLLPGALVRLHPGLARRTPVPSDERHGRLSRQMKTRSDKPGTTLLTRTDPRRAQFTGKQLLRARRQRCYDVFSFASANVRKGVRSQFSKWSELTTRHAWSWWS